MKNMGDRQRKVAHLVQEIVAMAVTGGKIRTPQNMGAFVSVSDVWVSADLRLGRIFVTVYGANPADVVAGLNAEAHHVHKILNQKMSMKYIPKIQFFYDDEFDHQSKLEQKINTLKAPEELHETPEEKH